MRRLIRSVQSDEDLIAIWRYVAIKNPEAATHLLRYLDNRIRSLIVHSFMGERQPQFGDTTRRLVVGSYLVFYDVLTDAVQVLRVLHSARKIEDLLAESQDA